MRPLKPSFQEQALRRWSARAPSQRASFPWEQQQRKKQSSSPHQVGQESDGARGLEPGEVGSSATLRSIVDYFGGSSSDGDIDDGVREEEGAGKNGVVWGKAAQDRDEGEHFRPSYLLEKRLVSAPWMHGEESANDQWAFGSVAGGEHGVDIDGVSDDELGLVDGDDEEVDNGGGTQSEGSEEETYEDYAVSTVNSYYGMDSVVDSGSKGGRYDRSTRQTSVNSIVKTLRNPMEEHSPNVAIEQSGGEDFVQKLGPVLLPWQREEDDEEAFGADRQGKRSNTELAERTIPEHELRRLRDAALRMKERMKIGPGGVTQDVVESIHRKWKVDEVVKMRLKALRP